MNKYVIVLLILINYTLKAQENISDATLEGLNGEKIQLSNLLDGKRSVLLNVGGTWCKPCLIQKPFVASLGQQFPQYLNVVYLFYRDSSEKIIDQFGHDILDKPYFIIDNVFLEKFSITTLPVNILVDYNGNVIKNDISINDVGSLLKK